MSIYDLYHRFFRDVFGENHRPPDSDENHNFDNPRDSLWDSGGEKNDHRDFTPLFDFKVTIDPFEMHKFFEQTMNEVMKSFTSPDGFPGIFGSGVFDSPNVPAIEENKDPREYYLKPGFNKTQPIQENSVKDHGDTISSSRLDKLLPTPGSQDRSSQPHVISTFTSVIRKTVTLPDGSVKTEEIIRNPDGTEHRTESHTSPDGNRSDPPTFDSFFGNPDISGFFNRPKMPQIGKIIPRDQFLKPGYEKFNPYGEKVDKDLDKQILQSGIENLPSFSQQRDVIEPNQNFIRTFRSITRRTVTLPSGVVESEEIMHNSDGTEHRTVTQTLPDGTSSTIRGPNPESSLGTGANQTNRVEDNKVIPSFALKGVKDFIDVLFK